MGVAEAFRHDTQVTVLWTRLAPRAGKRVDAGRARRLQRRIIEE